MSPTAHPTPKSPSSATLARFGLTADYMRLSLAPRLRVQRPVCGACEVTVRTEDDFYVCDSCGTGWPIDEARDDAEGMLYEDWSGESLGDRPAIRASEAWRYTHLEPGEREERAAGDGALA